MSVNSNGFVFSDGTILGATTGTKVPMGLNNAFADCVSLSQTTPQTLAGPINFAGLLSVMGGEACNIYVFTGTGNYSVTSSDRVVVVKKNVGENTRIALPNSPATGRILTVKDGRGDADSHPIVITAAQNLDSSAGIGGIVLNAPFASVDLIYNGTSWSILGGNGYDSSSLHQVFVENVKAHGAVGDGVTDDTIAIQSALAAAAGGTLYFPPGNYVISGTSVIPSHCVIMGPATVLAASSANWSGGIGPAFSNTGGTNISIKDMAFSYPYGTALYGGGSAHILEFNQTTNVAIQNVVCDGGAVAVYLNGVSKSALMGVQASNVSSFGVYHLAGAADAAVLASYFSTLPTAGTAASGIAFSGMNLDGTGNSSAGFKAIGNTISLVHNTGGAGILIEGHATSGSASKIIVADNHIKLASVSAYGVSVQGIVSDGVIHSNFLEGCSGIDAAINVGGAASELTISDNRASDWQAGSAGVFAIAATSSLIHDNVAAGSSAPVLGTFDVTSSHHNNYSGGTLLDGSTLNPSDLEQVHIVTAAGDYTALDTDRVVVINKTVAEITTVTLVANPPAGKTVTVKDGAGNAASFNITVAGNGDTIDGSASVVMNQNYAAIDLVFSGTEWSIL